MPPPIPTAPVLVHLASRTQLAAVAFTLLLVPSIWYVRTDLALFDELRPELVARFALRSLLILVLVYGLIRLRLGLRPLQYSNLAMTAAWTIVFCLAGLNALRPEGSGMPLRSPLFTLALLYAGIQNTFWRQVSPPLVLTASLVLLRVTRLDSSLTADVPGDLVILFSMNVVGVLLVRQRIRGEATITESWKSEQTARREAERALKQLRTLQGIIPICSHCKHVRTEFGDWEQVEVYVSEHSDAQFSHGVCPTCLKDVYDREPPQNSDQLH